MRQRLFPARLPEIVEMPLGFQDYMVTKITVSLSFLDRLRLLVSGTLLVDCRISTENRIGDTRTASMAYPLPPKFLSRSKPK